MREKLGIIVTTFNRANTAIPTLESLKKNLVYDEGRRFWVIADDGSPEGYVDSLLSVLGTDEPVYTTNSRRKGVGASKNLALQLAFQHTQIVFLGEDDWIMSEPLDVRTYCDLLVTNKNVGVIRLGYLSHGLEASLVGREQGYGDMCYWKIKQNSNQYSYSGQVSIRSRKWYDTIGYHTEGINAGQEELDMCGRFNTFNNPPEILFPANIAPHYQCGIFRTIGEGQSLNSVEPEIK